MLLQRIEDEGLAQYSYVVGSGDTPEVAVSIPVVTSTSTSTGPGDTRPESDSESVEPTLPPGPSGLAHRRPHWLSWRRRWISDCSGAHESGRAEHSSSGGDVAHGHRDEQRSAAGLAAHLAGGAAVSTSLALWLTGSAVVGMLAGMRGSNRVSSRQLHRAFVAFVGAVGSALVLVNAPTAARLVR